MNNVGAKSAALAVSLCIGLATSANERVALVIGNAAYEHVPPLANPRNDAEDMAALLGRLGFAVTEGLDLTDAAMEDRIRAFARRAKVAEVALLFYAGHGMQVGGVNYLLPVDARLADEADLDFEAVALDLVLKSMGTGTNLVFLDACRDNPFARSWAGTGRSAVGRGLTRVEGASASGMFIAFATDPDSIAADGEGRNSPFTAALKRHIETPGLEVNSLLTAVRNTVLGNTGNVQRPWSNSSLSAAFYFVPPPSSTIETAPGPIVGAPDPATETWLQIRATADVRQLERYIATYPNSPYRMAAELRLNELLLQPFTVMPEPPSARVRLAERTESYHAGMMLPAGEYPVEVSADGYETRTVTVRHDGSPTTQRVALRKVGLQTGDQFRECPECPEMVVVPAGSYRMGSPSDEQGREENEGTVHGVTISAPFAIGRHEVTVAEFGRFVDATGYSAKNSCSTHEPDSKKRAGRSWRNPGFGQSGRFPVVCVSWNDAQAYVVWLSRETGKEYRLPSESEWEYAARAGTSTARYWEGGESGQCRHANGADVSIQERYESWEEVVACRDGHVHTASVGRFAANDWGLHDMLGNVWEWTEDCWNDSYAGAPSDGNAWEYGDCAKRVLRGGSWYDTPSYLRASVRINSASGIRTSDFGFRVARTLTR